MDPVRAIGVRLASSLDCWCFRDPINGGSQWGIVRSVGTDRVSGGIVWGHSTDDGTLPRPRYPRTGHARKHRERRNTDIVSTAEA